MATFNAIRAMLQLQHSLVWTRADYQTRDYQVYTLPSEVDPLYIQMLIRRSASLWIASQRVLFSNSVGGANHAGRSSAAVSQAAAASGGPNASRTR